MERQPPARRIDLDAWERRDPFRFFRAYAQPFWSLCAEVDVTALLHRSREPGGPSFFLGALHGALVAANGVEELRTRIRGDGVVLHEVIHGGSTVLRPDGSFGFAYFDHDLDFARFAAAAGPVLEAARASTAPLDPRDDRDDLIHTTVIPWVSFTSFAHARRGVSDDSVPKLVFGRHHAAGDRQRMPVALDVHHALADGIHVGRFFAAFQHHLDGFGPPG